VSDSVCRALTPSPDPASLHPRKTRNRQPLPGQEGANEAEATRG